MVISKTNKKVITEISVMTFFAKVNVSYPPTTSPYKLSIVFLSVKAYCSIAGTPWCFFFYLKAERGTQRAAFCYAPELTRLASGQAFGTA